jgi:predicted TIM-barrel fold metal-dependent hydrolase
MRVIDGDAHVEESEATFADPYWDPALADRRPQIIQARESAYWLIDGYVAPRRRGKGAQHAATPPAAGGVKTRWAVSKVDSLESMTLADVDARLLYNRSEGIDVQVIFPTLFQAPLAEDPLMQNALCRSYNSWLADVCNQRPQALKWICLVNLEDVPGAIQELRRAKKLGAVGVYLLGMVGDEKLDHPRYAPFFAEATELDLPVNVHIGFPSPSLGRPYDTVYDAFMMPLTASMLTGFVDIVAGGVLDRFPTLRAAFWEAGCEWVPWLVGRMDHFYEVAVERGRWEYNAKRRPSDYLKDGGIYLGFEVEDRLLPQVVEQAGATQFLYASDIPHGDRMFGSVNYLRSREDLSPKAKELMLSDNAARFYKL